MSPNKRDLLLMLTALGAGAAMPAYAQAAALDLSAARAVGAAYRAAYPDEDFPAMRRALPAAGLTAEAVDLVRRSVAGDFHRNSVFIYEGWRLSRTEGRLFALFAAA